MSNDVVCEDIKGTVFRDERGQPMVLLKGFYGPLNDHKESEDECFRFYQ